MLIFERFFRVILVGLGANLPHPRFPTLPETLQAALDALDRCGVRVVRRSRWYRTAPVPASDQPWFVNGVAEVATTRAPADLLAVLHQVEAVFGRRRDRPLSPRLLDLDLLAYGDTAIAEGARSGGLILPHPRLHERAFVLVPLAELVPDWRHPVLGLEVATLIERLDPDQAIEPFD